MRALKSALRSSKAANVLYRSCFPSRAGGWPRIPFRDHVTAATVWRKFVVSDQYFGKDYLYQSYEPLHIPGVRPTARRFEAYRLGEILKPSDAVLDIGCNMGMFALYCAPRVRTVRGIDINPALIDIARYVAVRTGISNCDFRVGDFRDLEGHAAYDVIFAFAVHSWMKLPVDGLLEKLQPMLAAGGRVLVESHNYERTGAEFDSEVGKAVGRGYEILHSGLTHFDTARKFYALARSG